MNLHEDIQRIRQIMILEEMVQSDAWKSIKKTSFLQFLFCVCKKSLSLLPKTVLPVPDCPVNQYIITLFYL